MKKAFLALLAAILLFSFTLLDCNVCGTYELKGNTAVYVTIKEDGTFLTKYFDGNTYNGTWRIGDDKKTVYFTTSDGNYAQATLDDNGGFKDPEGGVWEKKKD